MWIKRDIEAELLELALQYPVVMITGPRQAGKTSLAQRCFPGKPYFSFENPDIREQIASDPRAFFSANPEGAVIDEFQRYPDILSYIQGFLMESLYILFAVWLVRGCCHLQLQFLHQGLAW